MSGKQTTDKSTKQTAQTITRRGALAAGAVAIAAAAGATVLAPDRSQAAGTKIVKQAEYLGVPWEKGYGYAQAVKVGDTIYLSGQLSHDDKGKMVAPAEIVNDDRIYDQRNMGLQMARSYANAKTLLARYGATMDNVVEEVLYLTDMGEAFKVAASVRAEAYGGPPIVASTILVTPRLAFAEQLVEIKLTAKV